MILHQEFDAIIKEVPYHFSYINPTTVLVSAPGCEYILYKRANWNCADDIERGLLVSFNELLGSKTLATGI